MKKRFSIKAFLIATLIHLMATWFLWVQGERSLAEWKRTGVELFLLCGARSGRGSCNLR